MAMTESNTGIRMTRRSFLGCTALAGVLAVAGLAVPVDAEVRVGTFGDVENQALPFTITFKPVDFDSGKTPPALHSHRVAATDAGDWLMLGGRGGAAKDVEDEKIPQSGLHGFAPPAANSPNFPVKSFNKDIWVYNFASGQSWRFDTESLPIELARPLQTTSQQSWYDRETDTLTLIGGYGWNDDRSDMITFDTMIQVSVSDLIAGIKAGFNADQIAALFRRTTHPLLCVTGGELLKVGDYFFLVMGQKFMGQYFAFGVGLPKTTTQEYTEEVRQITMAPGKFEILDVARLSQLDRAELHRRDLNVEMTMDAVTGKPQIGIYGGVFKAGGPGGFEKPVLFDPDTGTFRVQDEGRQIFNAYATSVIPIWSESQGIMAQVFFGGIGHGVYHTTNDPIGLDNDGMPFGMDISVLTHEKSGAWAEFVLPDPVPGRLLLAANSVFITEPGLRQAKSIEHDTIINLDTLPEGETTLVGWIHGGILADSPQPPKGPAQGDEVPTVATEKVFEVHVSRAAGAAIPVIEGS